MHNIIALRKRTRCTAAVLLRIVLKHANRYRFCLGIGPDNVLLRTSCPYITPQCTAATPECSEIAFIIFCFHCCHIPVCIRQQIPALTTWCFLAITIPLGLYHPTSPSQDDLRPADLWIAQHLLPRPAHRLAPPGSSSANVGLWSWGAG